MATQIKRMIEIGIDARGAKSGAQDVAQSMQKVVQTSGPASNEVRKVDKAIEDMGKASKGAKSEVERLDTAVAQVGSRAQSANAPLVKTGQALKQVNDESRAAAASMGLMGSVMSGLKGTIGGLLVGVTGLFAIKEVASAMVSSEDAMAKLGKVAKLGTEDLRTLNAEFNKLSSRVPVSTSELTKIAIQGSKLGTKGADDLLKFTSAVSKLALASDVPGDILARELGTILKVTGEGSGNVDKLAAAMYHLNAETSAPIATILELSESVSRATSLYKMSSSQVVALAASFAELGVESRSGGTVLIQTLTAIDEAIRKDDEKMTLLEAVMGKTSGQIAQMMKDNPAQLFIEFAKALETLDERGSSVNETLTKMGLSNDLLLKVLPALGKNAESVARHLDTASQAAEGLKKLPNEMTDTFGRMGSSIMKSSEGIIDGFTRASGAGTVAHVAVKAFQKTLEGVSWLMNDTGAAGKLLASALHGVTAALILLSAVKIGTFLKSTALSLLETAMASQALQKVLLSLAFGGIFEGIGAAVKTLFAAIGPVGWVILGISTVVSLVTWFMSNGDKASKVIDQMAERTTLLGTAANEAADGLKALREAVTANDYERQAVELEKLAKSYGTMKINLLMGQQSSLLNPANAAQGTVEPMVDVADLRKVFNKAGNEAMDAFLDGFSKTGEGQRQANMYKTMLGSLGGSMPIGPRNQSSGSTNFDPSNWMTAGPTAPVNPALQISKIPLSSAIELLDKNMKNASDTAAGLRKQLDDLLNGSAADREKRRGEEVFTAIMGELKAKYQLVGMGEMERAQAEAVADAKKAAASKSTKLTDDQIKQIEQLAAETYYYGQSLSLLQKQELDEAEAAKKQLEARSQAIKSLEDTLAGMQQETAALRLAGDARDEYQARMIVEKALRGEEIDDINKWVAAIQEEIRAQRDLKAAEDARKARSNEAQQQVKDYLDAESSLEDAIGQLDIEQKLIGKTNDERERAIEMIKLQKAAQEVYGDDADKWLSEYEKKLKKLQESKELFDFSKRIGDSFANVFDDVIFGAKSVEQAVGDMVKNVAKMVFDELVTKQIAKFFTNMIYNSFSASAGGAHAMGNVFSGGSVVPFAMGGVVSGPSLFPMSGRRTGLMGEAGPEAIMPLQRGPDGRLGVASHGGSGQVVNVSMTVVTKDADSFRQSSSQITSRIKRSMNRR